MSSIEKGTIKERLTRIEVLLCNHLAHHARMTKWLLGILSALAVGIILKALPGFCAWFGTL
jgi:hypothetical protein